MAGAGVRPLATARVAGTGVDSLATAGVAGAGVDSLEAAGIRAGAGVDSLAAAGVSGAGVGDFVRTLFAGEAMMKSWIFQVTVLAGIRGLVGLKRKDDGPTKKGNVSGARAVGI